jgi:ABC-type phosphate transport system substrate-binding protein
VRTLAAASLVGGVLVTITAPASHAGATPSNSAQTQTQHATPVTLQGAGAWSVSQLITPWANDLFGAPKPIDMQYTQHGSQLGRQALLAGTVDYAVTGVPFQPNEVPAKPGTTYIDAPVQVATLATVVEPFNTPLASRGGFGTFQQLAGRDADHPFCDPQDPDSWPFGPDGVTPIDGETQCIRRALYHGPMFDGQEMVRIPNQNLAAMYFHYLGQGSFALNAWQNPDVLNAFAIPQQAGQPPVTLDLGGGGYQRDAGPGIAGRSDPDEVTYFMQLFAKTDPKANSVWEGVKNSRFAAWEPITESLPRSTPDSVTRDGAEQQLDQLVNGGRGVGIFERGTAGGIAGVPPSMLQPFKVGFPNQPVMFAEMQNANGDWVGPTPEAINKAVDAGLDHPLYALTNNVQGAYPLVWVDHLYAPTHGLSQPKTEAMATMIRYLVTTGQTKEAAQGEGSLPAPLAEKALEAANNLVLSNCSGKDMKVVASTDPGPMAPASATEMKQIGSTLHCEATGATTPTTTITSPEGNSFTFDNSPSVDTGSFSNGSLSSGSSGLDTSSSSNDVSGGSTGAGGSAGSTSNGSGSPAATLNAQLVTANDLPIPAPTGTSGTDRLATFLIGVFLYLLLRKPVARMAKRVAL